MISNRGKNKASKFISPNLPIGQHWLTKLMESLGYNVTQKGACCGIAYMGMQAMLAKSLFLFNEKLFLLEHTPFNEIKQIHSSLKSIIDQTPHKINAISPIRDQKKWINTFKLLKGIERYQEKHIYQYGLIPYQSLDKKGGIKKINSFSGIYNENELEIYFTELEKVLHECRHMVVLVLKNSCHAITIGYQPTSKKWLYLDPNTMPAIELNTHQLIYALKRERVIKFSFNPQTKECHILNEEELKTCDNTKLCTITIPAFFAKEITGFNTEVYSVKKNSASISKLMQVLQNQKSWQDIHATTIQKANLVDHTGMSWLHFAAQDDFDAMSALLKLPEINIDCKTRDGTTPLFFAIDRNQYDIVKSLLKECDINFKNPEGFFPLFIASDKNNINILNLLLTDPRLLPNLMTNEGGTALHIAAQKGHYDVAQALLANSNVDPNQLTCEATSSPLHIAAQNNDFKMTKIILSSNKINPNLQLSNGATALFIAAMMGNREIVKLLMLKGTNPNYGYTDIDYLRDYFKKYPKDYNKFLQLIESKKSLDKVMITPAEMAKLMGHDDITAYINKKSLIPLHPLIKSDQLLFKKPTKDISHPSLKNSRVMTRSSFNPEPV